MTPGLPEPVIAAQASEGIALPPAAKAWAKAFEQPAKTFELQPLRLIEGSIPAELKGTFYQNGAARFSRGEASIGHWFDGDGAILAVQFAEGQARGCYRYVATEGYCAESEAGEFVKGGYGMLSPQPWIRRLGSPLTQAIKNVANTSVLALPDRLLALWEAAPPHSLDLETLETLGLDDLGSLKPSQGYSAHPKQDPQTGEIFNFGIEAGPVTRLHLYRSDRTGQIRQRAAYKLDGVPLIHDMVLAGRYLVFCISPVRLKLLPALLQLRSFSDSLDWQPQKGTEIWIFDCDTLERVSRNTVSPWFQWHFANGSLEQGEILLQLVRYPNFRSNGLLATVPQGFLAEDLGGELWQLRVDPQTAQLKTQTCLYGQTCEFPVVMPGQVGQQPSHIYFDAHRSAVETSGELFGALAQLDMESGEINLLDFGDDFYVNSPVCVPSTLGNSGAGWVMASMFDGEQNCSELWIFEAGAVEQGAIARLALPQVIPFGFHGTWA